MWNANVFVAWQDFLISKLDKMVLWCLTCEGLSKQIHKKVVDFVKKADTLAAQ